MMKLLLNIILFAFSSAALAQVEPDLDSLERKGDIFNLDIRMSFGGNVDFTLRRSDEGAFIVLNGVLHNYDKKRQRNEQVIDSKSIKISKQQELEIISLFQESIKNISLNDGGGMDGSNWCLMAEGYTTKIQLCFWTPSSNTAERGLIAFNKLGLYLAEIHQIEVE